MKTSISYHLQLHKLMVYLLLIPIVISCTEIGKQPINPKTQFKTTVKMNGMPFINISTNDCETLGGYQDKSSNAIFIKATDPKNFNQLTLFVYYENTSQLSPGRRLSVFSLSNPYPSFVGGAMESDTYQSWQTGLEGKVSGTLTIKSFDSATGLASFDVAFDAMLFQNGQLLANRKASFTGTFENVPIFADSDAWSDCFSGQQGFGNNSGSGNTTNPGTGNPPTTGGTNTTITFANKSFLPIDITFNGETKVIPFNGSTTFTGKAGSRATGTASCANKTTQGDQIGLKVSWNLDATFPTSGGSTTNLNVGTELFFLKFQNKSGKEITKLLVNYGLQSQTQDNIKIPADEKQYNIGYYKAFSNSNVRAENNNGVWSWPNLSLPFTLNQSQLVIANP